MHTTHTPGPWFVVHEVILVDHGNGEFPSVASCAGEPNAEANARLIAAAPDLLAELEKAADTFADCARTLSVLGRRTLATACEIAEQSSRAAIAKATGEPHA